MVEAGSQPGSDDFAAAFESLFDLSLVPMVIYDGQLIVRLNPAAARLFRIESPDAAVGREILDFVHPESLPRVQGRFAETLDQGVAMPIIETFIRDDGTAFDAEATSTSVPWPGGVAVAMALQDVSEREKTRSAAKEAEHRYRTLFDLSPDPLVVHDGSKVLLANHSAKTLFGLSVEQMRGRSVLDFVHPGQRDRVVARIRTMLESGNRPPRFELTLVLSDGRSVEAETSSAPVTLDGNRVIITVFRDVSERRRADEALRASEQRFRAIVEASPLGMHLYHLDDDGVLRFTGANSAADRFLGVNNDRFIGLAIEEAFPGLSETDVPERYRRIAMEGGVWSTDQIDYEEGEIRGAFEVYAFRTEERSMVAMFSDITERLRSQSELERYKNELESAVSVQTVELERAQRDLDAVATIASRTVEQRDPYTAGHQRRVAQLAAAIARALQLDESHVERIRVAATLHDIGKISVPAEILSKPGALTAIEYEFVKTHPGAAAAILRSVDVGWPLADIVEQHHERMDGSGYPDARRGEDTLFEARILAVADVVEAMASHRPYRPSLGVVRALAEIAENRGRLYDSQVVDACLAVMSGDFEFTDE